jgi:hypothetical protein
LKFRRSGSPVTLRRSSAGSAASAVKLGVIEKCFQKLPDYMESLRFEKKNLLGTQTIK